MTSHLGQFQDPWDSQAFTKGIKFKPVLGGGGGGGGRGGGGKKGRSDEARKQFVPALVALCGKKKTTSAHYYGRMTYFSCSIYWKGAFDL